MATVNVDPQSRAKSSAEAPATSIEDNRIEVQSVGEVLLLPDLYKFTVLIQSTKDTVEAVKQSVQRRLEYVRHVLHNTYKLPQSSVQVEKDVARTGERVQFRCDVHVACSSSQLAEDCRNTLVEKLDHASVVVTPIACSCTLKAREKAQSEALIKAVSNAQAKAESLALSVGLTLGPTLSVVERSEPLSASQMDLTGPHVLPPPSFEQSEGCLTLSQRVQAASLAFSSAVTAVFHLPPRRKCQHRTCLRHRQS